MRERQAAWRHHEWRRGGASVAGAWGEAILEVVSWTRLWGNVGCVLSSLKVGRTIL